MPLSYYGWTSRDCHTEWSVRQEKISYDIPYIWNLKNDRIKLIYKTHCKLNLQNDRIKLIHRCRKKTSGYQQGKKELRGGRYKLGDWY